MKKYKIGKRIIKADSVVEAVKISRMLDSPNTRVKSRDNEIDELTQEEQQAVEDYREAIKNTSNTKLLKIYSHILKEETEHLEELAQAREYEDSCGKMKDDRLSPQTYRKLKELGVRPEQWRKMTQEQANEFIRQKSQKGSKEKTSEKTSSSELLKKTKSIARVTNVSNKKQAEMILNALIDADAKTYDDVKTAARKINSKLDSIDIFEIAQIYLDTDNPFEKKEQKKQFEPKDEWEADAMSDVRRTLQYKENIFSTLEKTQKNAYETYEMTYGLEPDENAKAEIDRLVEKAYNEHNESDKGAATKNSAKRASDIATESPNIRSTKEAHEILNELVNAKATSKNDVQKIAKKINSELDSEDINVIFRIYSAERY